LYINQWGKKKRSSEEEMIRPVTGRELRNTALTNKEEERKLELKIIIK
jgi:hypothetical protein